jgi:transcription initiation factor TFIID subunit TAF12
MQSMSMTTDQNRLIIIKKSRRRKRNINMSRIPSITIKITQLQNSHTQSIHHNIQNSSRNKMSLTIKATKMTSHYWLFPKTLWKWRKMYKI